jgi:serine protease Do
MNNRTRTIASLFSVAMAAMLLGAMATQLKRPEVVRAASPGPVAVAAVSGSSGLTLDDFRQIARDVTPGVVNINTRKVVRSRGGRDVLREYFGDDFFGGGGDRGGARTQTSLGSGFVIAPEGYILTNRHVIEDADEIQVTLADGKTSYDAKLVGKDARTDVALLKIEPKGKLTTIPMGDSDRVDVAEWVMAVGAPFGLGSTVTVGVISYKGRDIPNQRGTSVEMLQTDASINPGNSGGPLLNARGEVVGINTMIVTQTGQSAGVGFAVPINLAKQILPQLRDKGRVVRGWLGVSMQPVSEELARSLKLGESRGALIADLDPHGPGLKAGLQPEDIILEANGKRIEDTSDLANIVSSQAPGSSVQLKVFRKGAEKSVSVTLGTFPEEEETASARSNESRGQAKLGLSLRDLTPAQVARLELPADTKGVVVTDVEAGEPGERAGLTQGDVILGVNGNPVQSVDEFEHEIDRARPDGLARLRVRRGSRQTLLILRLK